MPSAAVIVAHPDDETLWCGGFILERPDWDWFVLTLCRSSDADRAARFERALKYLGAEGALADLDDGPEQTPLDPSAIRHVIREGLPCSTYDFVFTHGPAGEYTRHLRHEECCRGVVSLWVEGQLKAGELKCFSYDDQNGTTLPRAAAYSDERHQLAPETLARKRHLITKIYGFDEKSWEARTTPEVEGFVDVDSLSKFDGLLLNKAASGPNQSAADESAAEENGPDRENAERVSSERNGTDSVRSDSVRSDPTPVLPQGESPQYDGARMMLKAP